MLLGIDEPKPVNAINEGASGSPFVLIGDHAGRAIPAKLGDLGLPPEERKRHIAWDIGVAELGAALSDFMAAHAIAKPEARAFGCTIKRKP